MAFTSFVDVSLFARFAEVGAGNFGKSFVVADDGSRRGKEAPLLHRWLVLVLGNPGPHDWPGSDWRAGHGGSLCLPAFHRTFSCHLLERSRFRRAPASFQGFVRDMRGGPGGPGYGRPQANRILAERSGIVVTRCGGYERQLCCRRRHRQLPIGARRSRRCHTALPEGSSYSSFRSPKQHQYRVLSA